MTRHAITLAICLLSLPATAKPSKVAKVENVAQSAQSAPPDAVEVWSQDVCPACRQLERTALNIRGLTLAVSGATSSDYPLPGQRMYPVVRYLDGFMDHGERIYSGASRWSLWVKVKQSER